MVCQDINITVTAISDQQNTNENLQNDIANLETQAIQVFDRMITNDDET